MFFLTVIIIHLFLLIQDYLKKYAKPRCFPRDQSKLPVTYKFSANAWMTGQIYTNWLQNWNWSLIAVGRKILGASTDEELIQHAKRARCEEEEVVQE